MSDPSHRPKTTVPEVLSFFGSILGPEKNYYLLALVYGLGISALSLALPISVQMLVNTVANTGLTTPLALLSLTLFVLLLSAGLLNALRIHLIDLFGRRFYARMVSEISLRSVYALNPFFDDNNEGHLFNRYFDILVVQKTLPNLLIGGFTIVLQAGFGFVLVSLYHPWFLAFTIVLIVLVWIIWLIWGPRAIMSAVDLSHRKHAVAAWLEGLGGSNGFFKSERHIADALKRTDAATAYYMEAHERHFRHHFSQTVCFLFLYALASAGLLGMGGYLVIQGELSLGQLVAAEVVLSVVLSGISQLGRYLEYFYDVCGSLDELALFYRIEQEEPVSQAHPLELEGDATIDFVGALGDARGVPTMLNFSIPGGARVLAVAETHGVQREVTNFLKRHIRPASGYVAVAGQDINGVQAHELRQQVIVLDRPNAIEMTIREYLHLSGANEPARRVLEVLKAVGLEPVITQLEDGMDTRVASTGWPLSITETMQLKLASAIIARPRVLILSELFDALADEHLAQAFELLQRAAKTTIVYFSSYPRALGFDLYLYLGLQEQQMFSSFDAMCGQVDGVVGRRRGMTTASGDAIGRVEA